MNKIKLFCFPYAGGSAMVYAKWQKYLDPKIELVPIELAGRGRRIHESFYTNMTDVVQDVFKLIKEQINGSPYALFGHSLGGTISYELALRINKDKFPPPEHIFISGRGAPHVKKQREKVYHLMNDDEFKREILELGGTSSELFEHPELLEVFVPLLKNDFRLAESGVYDDSCIQPFAEAITAFFGKEEDMIQEQRDGWRLYSKRSCDIHYFEGGHFFLLTQTEQIVNIINKTLN